MLAYFLAVLAAASNATSNVLQRKANREEPPELSMSPRLILDLLHRPAWLAGFATVIASFILDAAALSMGRLSAVQPILVLELPMTLIAGSRVFGARLPRRDWGAVLILTGGVAGLLVSLDPRAGKGGPIGAGTWIVATAVTLGAVATCVVVGVRSRSGRRAAFLGLASGISFGLTAAYMKSATGAIPAGAVGVLTSWSTYAMALSGLTAMFLMQNALQAGRLIAAQPGITLADPGVSILWGIVVFAEKVDGGAMVVAQVAAAAALAVGTVLLTRSPLLEAAEDGNDGGGDDEDGRRPAAADRTSR